VTPNRNFSIWVKFWASAQETGIMIGNVTKRSNKRAAIDRAYEVLGANATAKSIVEYIKDKEGINVSQMYVYACRVNMSEEMNVSPKAIDLAKSLVREVGSIKAATAAIRQANDEDEAVNNVINKFEERIKSLELKKSSSPEEIEQIKAQIEELKSKIDTAKNLSD